MPVASSEAVTTIERFFERWSVSWEEACASFRETFAEGGEWYAGPPPAIPVTHGAEEAIGLLQNFRDQYDLTTIDVDVLNIAESGGIVYSERVDHIVDSNGERVISLPLAGVMKLDDEGKITYWRDYWDMQELLQLSS